MSAATESKSGERDDGMYRVAADIGGTFTDIACLSPDGVLSTYKLPSTPHAYGDAVLAGLRAIADGNALQLQDFAEILHASTVATNAILEGKGAKTALITTEGFRDVLELRRIRVPRLYEPLYEKPAPLAPRRLRFEVRERMGPRGEIITPIDLKGVEAIARHLASLDIEAVALCFLHAYANPAHEQAAAEIIRQILPHCFLSVSSDVLPEIREYERTSTTTANAYIGPAIAGYLQALQADLKEAGAVGRLLMMRSSGGVVDADRVIEKPAYVVESGPAAGVIGAARLSAAAGRQNVITFDMGGTTAKASLVENGQVLSTDEFEVGGGISLSSRLVKGGGYAIKLPVIDVSEVGAGGGSIVWIDQAGALKVGPKSAGAYPGPACYLNGGDLPTITDANVALGYLNPRGLAGGSVPISVERARAALEKVASALGGNVLDVAFGVHRLANATMVRAVKAVTTYRGRDPRDFDLIAFGGNGGVHGASLAKDLQIARVIVPPAAGVFSAVGLLFADIEADRTSAIMRPVSGLDLSEIVARAMQMEASARAELGGATDIQTIWTADLRYHGQAFELPIVLDPSALKAGDLSGIQSDFEKEHQRTYGHILPDADMVLVNLRVRAAIPSKAPVRFSRSSATILSESERQAYFGPEFGLLLTPVIPREALSAVPRKGPLIIEEYDCVTVVPPDARATLDAFGDIVLEYEGAS